MLRSIIASSINPSTASTVAQFRAHPMVLEGHILAILCHIKLHTQPRRSFPLTDISIEHCQEFAINDIAIIEKCFEIFHVPLLCGSEIFRTFMLKPLTFGMIEENIVATFEICLVFIMWADSIEQRIGTDLSTRELILWNTVQTSLIDSGIELSCFELQKRCIDRASKLDMAQFSNTHNSHCRTSSAAHEHGGPYSYAGGFAFFWADMLMALDTWGLAQVMSQALNKIGVALTERSLRRLSS